MSTYKMITMVLGLFLATASSCSERLVDEIETSKTNTQSITFEKQKGKMMPVAGSVESYVGCPSPPYILRTFCCFNENRQTYLSNARIGAKAVADGEVVKVKIFEQPNVHGVVIIKHGAYMTVYGNLNKICVREGDKISLGHFIGEAGANYDGTQNRLFLDIYSKGHTINPKEWLRQSN